MREMRIRHRACAAVTVARAIAASCLALALTPAVARAQEVWSPHTVIDAGGTVRQIAISRGGSHVAASLHPSTVKIWSAADGRLVSDWAREKPSTARRGPEIKALAFSHDARRLAVSSSDGVIVMLDVAGGRAETRLTDHTSFAHALTFDRRGVSLVSASSSVSDFSMRLWDLETGLLVSRTRLSGLGEVVVFSPAGDLIAVSSWDRVEIYARPATRPAAAQPAAALQKIGSLMAGSRHQPVEDIRVSEDGTIVAIAGGDGRLHGWSTRARREVWSLESRGRIAFCGPGKLLNVTRRDDVLEARVWDLATRQVDRRATLQRARPAAVFYYTIAEDCSAVVASQSDGTIEIWKVPAAPSDVPPSGAASPATAAAGASERERATTLIASERSTRLGPFNGDWRAMLALRIGGEPDSYPALYQLALARKALADHHVEIADEFLRGGDAARALQYATKAARLNIDAQSLVKAANEVFMSGVSRAAAILTSIYTGAREAAALTAAVACSYTCYEAVSYASLLTDYLVDRAVTSEDEAARQAIRRGVLQAVLKGTGVADVARRSVTHMVGSPDSASLIVDRVLQTPGMKAEIMTAIGRTSIYATDQAVGAVAERMLDAANTLNVDAQTRGATMLTGGEAATWTGRIHGTLREKGLVRVTLSLRRVGSTMHGTAEERFERGRPSLAEVVWHSISCSQNRPLGTSGAR